MLLLHTISIALSALLLFLVQPIIAKQILPWFGGSAGVWTTCLVFFQTLLLGGYAYAHWLANRLPPRGQWVLHTGLLAASLVCLPIVAADRFRPAGGEDAAVAILVLLAATIGLPYFLLASTGPLLQSWLARRWPARSVYRLFALSNAGSLAGLMAFPLLIEPHYGSRVQAFGWSAAYTAFAMTCAGAAWVTRHRPARASAPADVSSAEAWGADAGLPAAAPPGAEAGSWTWLALSALGVVILLGATAHMSQNVASVPFLWLAPLILYLLSFVIAFEGRSGRGWYSPGWGIPAALVAAMLMASGLSASGGVLNVWLAVPLYCLGVLLTCLFCHGELAARRPEAGSLTRFYLMISLGGALGGIFAGLIAPRVFDSVYEFPLALFGVCVAALLAAWTSSVLGGLRHGLCSLAALSALATAYWDISFIGFLRSDVILMKRNFYGTLRVREVGQGQYQVRRLLHGVILHGEQYTRAVDRQEPGTYYARSSGVGLAIQAAQQRHAAIRLGVIGLGAGTLSAYGRAGDVVRFYEIDPDVVTIARQEFTYLTSTPATVQMAIGDARLSLQRELDQGQSPRFDVLAVDAFSSDSIPVHLLTRQALQIYTRCVGDGGIIAVHISNRFLDLKPVLANLVADLGLSARLVRDDPDEGSRASSSDWVLISTQAAAFVGPPLADRVEALKPDPRVGVWTDQFNNLLGILKGRPARALQDLWSD
ncbi:MAG TPA: fused MFS/spermidine synthase [Burkholderiaceae bacterium]|nr:fused MFS/spermidine synthase [Burkholderiaceae bacterium]